MKRVHKIKLNCDHCGKDIYIYKYQLKNKHHFCDKVCLSKWQSEQFAGENSHFWKGGKIEVSCSYCGKKLERSKNHNDRTKNNFCNHECYGKWLTKNKTGENSTRWNGGLVKTNCSFCSAEIDKMACIIKRNKNSFCNKKCYSEFMKTKIKTNCSFCGKEILITASRIKRIKNTYCGPVCLKKHTSVLRSQKKDVACDFCGKIFKLKPSRIKKNKKHYCSRSCMQNGQYKGGKRAISLELRDSYVIDLLAKHCNVKINRKDIPQSLVDIHREIIKIKRYLKEKKL